MYITATGATFGHLSVPTYDLSGVLESGSMSWLGALGRQFGRMHKIGMQ